MAILWKKDVPNENEKKTNRGELGRQAEKLQKLTQHELQELREKRIKEKENPKRNDPEDMNTDEKRIDPENMSADKELEEKLRKQIGEWREKKNK